MPPSDSPGPEPDHSLLDRRSTGGVHAWVGFSAQTRYILVSAARWLVDTRCEGFQPERSEDVDVFYRDGIKDYHQVKMENLTPGDVKELIKNFHSRHKPGVVAGQVRNFVIATRVSSDAVKAAVGALDRYRKQTFDGPGDPQRIATLADLRKRLVDANVVDAADFDFVLDHVQVWDEWGGLERGTDPWARVAGEFGRIDSLSGYPVGELIAAAKEFAHRVEQRKDGFWPREEVLTVLREAIDNYRAGPPTASGSVVFLCHQSLMPVQAP